jgi:tetratricopeptide (TPR) repeat protein
MKLLEPYFIGKRKLMLSVSPKAEFERWKQATGVADARLWHLPYETLRQRAALPLPLVQGRLLSFLPFYALPYVTVPKEGSVPGLVGGGEEMRLEMSSSRERFVQAPLCGGRILHLKGRLAGDPGAMMYYQLARPSRNEMFAWGESLIANHVEEGMKGQKDLSEEEARRRQKLLRDQAELTAQVQMKLINQGKQYATYWLGLTAYQRGNYSAAIDYLNTRTLEVQSEGIWAHGARYNYARAAEAEGDFDRAILLYQSDSRASDADGQLLRAKWLQSRPKKTKAGKEKLEENGLRARPTSDSR